MHQGELLTHVCMEENCKNNFLNCSVCIEEYHYKHNHMLIKSLISSINDQAEGNQFVN